MADLKLSELKDAKKEQWGMIIYKISDDGVVCLYGDWTNNRNSSEIFNEIARKKDKNSRDIDGDYNVSWIQNEAKTINGTLKISRNPNENKYCFEWRNDKGNLYFEGIVMQLRDKQIAVIYWDF